MTFTPEQSAYLEGQTNGPLLHQRDIWRCRDITSDLGLPQHGDPPKAWDNLLAVYWAQKWVDPLVGCVLDAGIANGSAFIQGLRELGHRPPNGLWGVGLEAPIGLGPGMSMAQGDITDMRSLFGDGRLDFIACQSVIEHGVDVPKFLGEAARVLKPGGHLFVSTDYWHAPVDTGGQVAFGAPVKVFGPEEIVGLCDQAAAVGLHLTSPLRIGCSEATVLWLGMRYTFLAILLRKEG